MSSDYLGYGNEYTGRYLFHLLSPVQRTCLLGAILRLLQENPAFLECNTILSCNSRIIRFNDSLCIFHSIFKRILTPDEEYSLDLSDVADVLYMSFSPVERLSSLRLLVSVLISHASSFAQFYLPIPEINYEFSYQECILFMQDFTQYLVDNNLLCD